MKKALLATAVLMFMAIVASADGPYRGVPRGGPQSLATADYGGVSYATQAFGTAAGVVLHATACVTCRGVFYGIVFSSGSASAYDFVDVFDSTSSDRANLEGSFVRLYNMNGSTATGLGANGASASGFSGPPKPIHFDKGLIFRASVATYNKLTALFYREPDKNGP